MKRWLILKKTVKLLWKELKKDIARYWFQDHRIIKISVVSIIPSILLYSAGFYLLRILHEPWDVAAFLACAYSGAVVSVVLALWLYSVSDRVSGTD